MIIVAMYKNMCVVRFLIHLDNITTRVNLVLAILGQRISRANQQCSKTITWIWNARVIILKVYCQKAFFYKGWLDRWCRQHELLRHARMFLPTQKYDAIRLPPRH